MARKAKGAVFKMKSGNSPLFKQMGSSPVLQQADATLVAAARHAAMQNVPKDLSAQYNKTAEGVIAAQKGKTEALTTLAKEAPGLLTAAGRGINKAFGGKGDYNTSISDIRKITGATTSESKKDPDYKNLLSKLKYEKQIAKNQNNGKGVSETTSQPKEKGAGNSENESQFEKAMTSGTSTGQLDAPKPITTADESENSPEPKIRVKTKKDHQKRAEKDWQQDDASMVEKGTDDNKEKGADDKKKDTGKSDTGKSDSGGSDTGSAATMKRSFYKMKYNNKSFPFKK